MELMQGYKQTELGIIPTEWDVKLLIEIAEIATGTTPPTRDKNNYGEDFLFVSPADLGKGKYIDNTEKKLSKLGFSLARKYPANSNLHVLDQR
jgi:type I restriction enzyme S subunit